MKDSNEVVKSVVKKEIHEMDNVKTVRILTGDALEEKAPLGINVSGNITAVSRFLNKRTIEVENCMVVVNRDAGSIRLVVEECNPDFGAVNAELKKTTDLNSWNINSSKSWEPEDLANHIKMNRNCFESKEVAMKIHSDLKHFRAKVNNEVEKKNDDRGNTLSLRQQAVESNLPESFRMNFSVFKGEDPVNFLVEVNIHPQTLECMLVSPELKDFITEQTDLVIDRELELIDKSYPQLVVIES